MALSGPFRPPVTGDKPVRLVILLHGRGSDGDDLLDLQRFRGRLVPDAEFISPNAPFPSDMAPTGYQWFRTQDRSPASVLAGVHVTAPSLDAFIGGEELQKRGLTESDAVLVGFSQGTMMALHVGLRRERPLAGIIGYSGRLIGPPACRGIALAPAGTARTRHQRHTGAGGVDDGSGDGAAGGRRPGRHTRLRRHRALHRLGGVVARRPFPATGARCTCALTADGWSRKALTASRQHRSY
jgi:predicted esterase